MDPLDRHLAWFGTATPELARGLLAPELRQQLGPADERGYLRDFAARADEARLPGWPEHPGLLVWQLLDFDLYLGGGLLTKVDRCTMAHSVESRAPFLRHALIRFALGLPDDARLRGKTGKRALRLAARGLLPPAILTRRKQGFSPPFSVVGARAAARAGRGAAGAGAPPRRGRARRGGRAPRARGARRAAAPSAGARCGRCSACRCGPSAGSRGARETPRRSPFARGPPPRPPPSPGTAGPSSALSAAPDAPFQPLVTARHAGC